MCLSTYEVKENTIVFKSYVNMTSRDVKNLPSWTFLQQSWRLSLICFCDDMVTIDF